MSTRAKCEVIGRRYRAKTRERRHTSQMTSDMIPLHTSRPAPFPSTGERQVVRALPPHMGIAQMIIQRLGRERNVRTAFPLAHYLFFRRTVGCWACVELVLFCFVHPSFLGHGVVVRVVQRRREGLDGRCGSAGRGGRLEPKGEVEVVLYLSLDVRVRVRVRVGVRVEWQGEREGEWWVSGVCHAVASVAVDSPRSVQCCHAVSYR